MRAGANNAAVAAFTALDANCTSFNPSATDTTLYDALCAPLVSAAGSDAGSVDARVLSSVYQCVTVEGIEDWNSYGARRRVRRGVVLLVNE